MAVDPDAEENRDQPERSVSARSEVPQYRINCHKAEPSKELRSGSESNHRQQAAENRGNGGGERIVSGVQTEIENSYHHYRQHRRKEQKDPLKPEGPERGIIKQLGQPLGIEPGGARCREGIHIYVREPPVCDKILRVSQMPPHVRIGYAIPAGPVDLCDKDCGQQGRKGKDSPAQREGYVRFRFL